VKLKHKQIKFGWDQMVISIVCCYYVTMNEMSVWSWGRDHPYGFKLCTMNKTQTMWLIHTHVTQRYSTLKVFTTTTVSLTLEAQV